VKKGVTGHQYPRAPDTSVLPGCHHTENGTLQFPCKSLWVHPLSDRACVGGPKKLIATECRFEKDGPTAACPIATEYLIK
jgi:hypothetical protein